MLVRIHDLLEIDAERFVHAHAPIPPWVAESLRRAPFVVVRRGPASEREIPAGVRGAQRNERWGGSCHPSLVHRILTPHSLLGRAVHAPRADAIAALRALPLLAERWKDLECAWGPAGSVGFELATGCHVASPRSDLDVVIYAERRMTRDEAFGLRDGAQGLPAAVDIRVETPICGFSLTEYANRAPAPILLRVASGAVLGTDPWGEPAITSASHATAGAAVGPVAPGRP
jgi:phosphoribosyl-dephospho-CoA transferase